MKQTKQQAERLSDLIAQKFMEFIEDNEIEIEKKFVFKQVTGISYPEPKYKVGQTLYQRIKGIEPYELLTEEEFELLLSAWDTKEGKDDIAGDFIKLKIISETEDKYKVVMVK